MGKKCAKKLLMLAFFTFCRPLRGIKTLQKDFLSGRGGSKLRFGGSYVKIS